MKLYLLPPHRMSAEQRLDEVAYLLAQGLLRLRAYNAKRTVVSTDKLMDLISAEN